MLEQIGLRIAMALNGVHAPLKRDEGQTLVEYGLILVAISIAVTGLLFALGGKLQTVFTQVVNAV